MMTRMIMILNTNINRPQCIVIADRNLLWEFHWKNVLGPELLLQCEHYNIQRFQVLHSFRRSSGKVRLSCAFRQVEQIE